MASHPTPPLATKRSQSDASADFAEVLKTLLLLAHHDETPDAESNCLDALLNASKMLENSETAKQDICTTAVIDLCIDSTKEDASFQMIDLCTDSTIKADSSSPPLAYHPPTLRQEGYIPTKSLNSQVAFGLGEEDDIVYWSLLNPPPLEKPALATEADTTIHEPTQSEEWIQDLIRQKDGYQNQVGIRFGVDNPRFHCCCSCCWFGCRLLFLHCAGGRIKSLLR